MSTAHNSLLHWLKEKMGIYVQDLQDLGLVLRDGRVIAYILVTHGVALESRLGVSLQCLREKMIGKEEAPRASITEISENGVEEDENQYITDLKSAILHELFDDYGWGTQDNAKGADLSAILREIFEDYGSTIQDNDAKVGSLREFLNGEINEESITDPGSGILHELFDDIVRITERGFTSEARSDNAGAHVNECNTKPEEKDVCDFARGKFSQAGAKVDGRKAKGSNLCEGIANNPDPLSRGKEDLCEIRLENKRVTKSDSKWEEILKFISKRRSNIPDSQCRGNEDNREARAGNRQVSRSKSKQEEIHELISERILNIPDSQIRGKEDHSEFKAVRRSSESESKWKDVHELISERITDIPDSQNIGKNLAESQCKELDTSTERQPNRTTRVLGSLSKPKSENSLGKDLKEFTSRKPCHRTTSWRRYYQFLVCLKPWLSLIGMNVENSELRGVAQGDTSEAIKFLYAMYVCLEQTPCVKAQWPCVKAQCNGNRVGRFHVEFVARLNF